jgi:hypothetical protein
MVAAHIKLREQQLKDRRVADGQKAELSTTKLIAEAATEVFGHKLAEEVVLEWRSGSGAAHGLSWHLFGTPGTEQVSEADRNGRASFQAGGSFDRMANSYMSSFRLLEHGWKLLRLRGT